MTDKLEGQLSAGFSYGRSNIFKYFYAVPTTAGIRLFWDVFPVISPSEEPFTFRIYRANGVYSPVEFTLLDSVEDAWTYLDTSYTEYSKRYNVSYKLILATSKTEYESEIINIFGDIQPRSKARIKAILRRVHLSQQSARHYKSLFLKRRHFGVKCSCIDPITNDVVKTDCSLCYGTGFLGGYWKTPVPITLIASSPLSNTIVFDTSQNVGTVNPGVIKVKVAYPLIIDQYDALIHISTGNRFYITAAQVSAEVEGFPIIYDLEMRLAERKDSLYNYVI